MQIRKLTPNLVVRNVEASLRFYSEILGLEKAMTVPDESPYIFAAVSNGAVEIFFNDQKSVAAEYPKLAASIGASLTLYMEVDSLQPVFDRVQKAGAKVSMPITDQFYGMNIGDHLLWLRLFEFYSFEIGGCDLECVEQEARGLAFEALL